jgi:hypothetical protein
MACAEVAAVNATAATPATTIDLIMAPPGFGFRNDRALCLFASFDPDQARGNDVTAGLIASVYDSKERLIDSVKPTGLLTSPPTLPTLAKCRLTP